MFGTITEKDELNDIFKDPCSGDSGGPLVVLGPTHHILIGRDIFKQQKYLQFFHVSGTLFGAGYNCKDNTVSVTEGFHDGIWNNVSKHVPWIENIAAEMGEKLCFGQIIH